MNVELINPFVAATTDVFKTMLSCDLTRGAIGLKQEHTPMYEVSGLIGLSGKCRGMVVVSVSRDTALAATQALLGERPTGLNTEVFDAIGEVTNMIAGAAKGRMEELCLSVGLPTVICGRSQAIAFPSQSTPLIIPFDSEIGEICIQVGLEESPCA